MNPADPRPAPAPEQAMQDAPNTHKPDAPFTTWAVLHATAFDGTEHHFHVPADALSRPAPVTTAPAPHDFIAGPGVFANPPLCVCGRSVDDPVHDLEAGESTPPTSPRPSVTPIRTCRVCDQRMGRDEPRHEHFSHGKRI